MAKKLDSNLEKQVVAPVAAAVLGLRRDTVFWQKGLLSSPPVRQAKHAVPDSTWFAWARLVSASVNPECQDFMPCKEQ